AIRSVPFLQHVPFFLSPILFNHASVSDHYALSLHDALPIYLMRRFLPPPRLSRALPARTTREPELRIALPHFDFGGEPRLGPRLLDCIAKLGAPRRVALHPEVEGRLRDSRSTSRHPIECTCADIGDDLLLDLVG